MALGKQSDVKCDHKFTKLAGGGKICSLCGSGSGINAQHTEAEDLAPFVEAIKKYRKLRNKNK